MKLLIGIPALNEEKSIARIVARCLEARDGIHRNYTVREIHITVLNDGSTDDLA